MANWEKIRTSVTRTANKAAVKAGELSESAKLKYKIHQAKGMLNELYEKLGRIEYDQRKFGLDRSEEAEELVLRIEKMHSRIRRLTAAASREDNAVYCTGCGTRLEGDMAYCPGCGMKQTSAQAKAAQTETNEAQESET